MNLTMELRQEIYMRKRTAKKLSRLLRRYQAQGSRVEIGVRGIGLTFTGSIMRIGKGIVTLLKDGKARVDVCVEDIQYIEET